MLNRQACDRFESSLGSDLRLSVRACLFLCAALLCACASPDSHVVEDPNTLVDEYIAAWRDFYPSQAFAYGDADSAMAFENFGGDRVAVWLGRNAAMLSRAKTQLSAGATGTARLDLQVLVAQIEDELATWREDSPLREQPQWYAEQVSQAMTHLLVRDQLSAAQRREAALLRLRGVARLCRLGVQALRAGNVLRMDRALRTLEGTRAFYADGLASLLQDGASTSETQQLTLALDESVAAIDALSAHLRDTVMPGASKSPAIGKVRYAAKLSRRTSGLYNPDKLRNVSGGEVREVRLLMVKEAQRWRDTLEDPQQLATLDDDALLNAAIEAMENDRQDNSADFLASFSELTYAAERFVEERGLATIPKPTTLMIDLSPAHFSGAAVGGVYPSGPFAPEADTLFYIPSIPDSATEAAKTGFYRSFNTHFNTMILSHEMFPGHYLQYKVAVSQAPALRSLFPNGSYVEGWGSFVEELMLNAGWADNAPLTRLAHLRKRLENATRAYVSVQVNTADWDEAQVRSFAVDEGLLAPQFAVNLWQRVVNSPLQITDYLTGYLEFRRLYGEYRADSEYLGSRPWVDAVLQAGPLPMTLLASEL